MNGKMVAIGLFLVITLLNMVYIVSSSTYDFSSSNGVIAWINETGSLNISEDFLCVACINTEDVNDIDKSDIEGDVNTFVDITGDTMTDDLYITSASPNIYFTDTGDSGNTWMFWKNSTSSNIAGLGWDYTNKNFEMYSYLTGKNILEVDVSGNITVVGRLEFPNYCIYDNGTHLIEESC